MKSVMTTTQLTKMGDQLAVNLKLHFHEPLLVCKLAYAAQFEAMGIELELKHVMMVTTQILKVAKMTDQGSLTAIYELTMVVLLQISDIQFEVIQSY